MLEPDKIKKILFVSLSNIGDIVLTFPVLDILIHDFPGRSLSVVVGPKGEELLKGNPHLDKIFIFHKHQKFWQTLRWLGTLRQEHFDLAVDLRNTAIPFFLGIRYATSPFMKRGGQIHMREKHLDHLRSVYPFEERDCPGRALNITAENEKKITRMLENLPGNKDDFVIISTGAADQNKRWNAEGFAKVADEIMSRYRIPAVFVGNDDDALLAQEIMAKIKAPVVNLSGQTTLLELAALLKRCRLAICNDSGPLHLASYLNVPTLALFGPTNPRQYGPWGACGTGAVIAKNSSCPACNRSIRGHGLRPWRGDSPRATGKWPSAARSLEGKGGKHSCMQAITPEDVLNAFEIRDGKVFFSEP